MNVLVVDDQRSARHVLSALLTDLGASSLHEAASLAEARRVLERQAIDVAFIDIRLSEDARNADGLVLVREVRQKTSAVPIVVTAFGEMSEIRSAMRAGAYDYVLKDELCEELLAPLVEGLRSRARMERELAHHRARAAFDRLPEGLVGTSQAMERVRETIRRVALSDRPVLVTGPTGSGKELVVRAIHALGPQPDAPVLDVSCGAIPELLMESLLFGHERGAFTGAEARQVGYLTAVGEGTLFLDEIAELPLALQAKLLRVLETHTFRPLGTTEEQRMRGRVVAATHVDLEARVAKGLFREDLYYRLNVLSVRVPGLDERREDIPALVAHFARLQRNPIRFSAAALDVLARGDWPGNVRQLRNAVDRAAVLAEHDPIEPEDLSPTAAASSPEAILDRVARTVLGLPLDDKLEAVESALLAAAMTEARGNKTQAARLLGVHRKVVERRLGTKDATES